MTDPIRPAAAGPEPSLQPDRTIELLARLAKALVVVVYAVVLATFVLLVLGFLLRLTGASPEATFVDWVYRTTERTMQPFRGMFPVSSIDGRSVFDASLLFAAAFYGFVAIGLHALVAYLSGVARRYHLRHQLASRDHNTAEYPVLHSRIPAAVPPMPLPVRDRSGEGEPLGPGAAGEPTVEVGPVPAAERREVGADRA